MSVRLHGVLMALAIHKQACLIYGEHSTDVRSRNGYFPGDQANGDDRIQEAKNIYVRSYYRYRVLCDEWGSFEMSLCFLNGINHVSRNDNLYNSIK